MESMKDSFMFPAALGQRCESDETGRSHRGRVHYDLTAGENFTSAQRPTAVHFGSLLFSLLLSSFPFCFSPVSSSPFLFRTLLSSFLLFFSHLSYPFCPPLCFLLASPPLAVRLSPSLSSAELASGRRDGGGVTSSCPSLLF